MIISRSHTLLPKIHRSGNQRLWHRLRLQFAHALWQYFLRRERQNLHHPSQAAQSERTDGSTKLSEPAGHQKDQQNVSSVDHRLIIDVSNDVFLRDKTSSNPIVTLKWKKRLLIENVLNSRRKCIGSESPITAIQNLTIRTKKSEGKAPKISKVEKYKVLFNES